MTHPQEPRHEEKKKARGGEAMIMTSGINWLAALSGWVVAFFTGLILSSLVGALVSGLGGIASQASTSIGTAGGVAGLVVWFISFFLGGLTAGRINRINGFVQGLAVWLVGLAFMILLLILASILGPGLAVVGGITLPAASNIATILTIGTLILLAVQLAGAVLGGWIGERSQNMMRS